MPAGRSGVAGCQSNVPVGIVLLWIAPGVGIATILGAWACYLLDMERIANYLALGPWLAGVALISTTAILISAALPRSRP